MQKKLKHITSYLIIAILFLGNIGFVHFSGICGCENNIIVFEKTDGCVKTDESRCCGSSVSYEETICFISDCQKKECFYDCDKIVKYYFLQIDQYNYSPEQSKQIIKEIDYIVVFNPDYDEVNKLALAEYNKFIPPKPNKKDIVIFSKRIKVHPLLRFC